MKVLNRIADSYFFTPSKASTILIFISSKESTIFTLPYRLYVLPSLVIVQFSLSILTSEATAKVTKNEQIKMEKKRFIYLISYDCIKQPFLSIERIGATSFLLHMAICVVFFAGLTLALSN